jgi:transposase
MSDICIIGLDTAKHVFQVHAVGKEKTILRRRLPRDRVLPFFASFAPCTVGLEACGAAHHWAREIAKFGHDVRLMPPSYVKPYVKRNKNDAADAEACCEAVGRPSMRFVPVKTEDQQAALVRHKVRDVLVRQRTQWVNALRGHLAEFGVTVRKGLSRVADLVAVIEDEADHRVPTVARAALRIIIDVLAGIDRKIEDLDREVATSAKADLVAKRLMTVPGVGPIIASRTAASFPNPDVFRSGRDFAASLGLVPRQNSTGGKSLLGGISKQGSGTLRRLLVGGAMAALFRSKEWRSDPWLVALRERKPTKVVAVALANKMARAIWAIMTHGGVWRSRPVDGTAVLAFVKPEPPMAAAYGRA